MKGMMDMMKQAHTLQTNMKKMQQELAERKVTGQAGNGLVQVVMTCTNELQSVSIQPEAVDPADVETLEDLVQVAVSDALAQAKAVTEEEMQKATGGAKLPGM